MLKKRQRSAGFTIVELMIVVAIIIVLIAILIPVVSKVRKNAYAANTKNFVSQLSSSIEIYQQQFRAYPGPLANDEIWNPIGGGVHPQAGQAGFSGAAITVSPSQNAPAWDVSQSNPLFSAGITMSENLVLGLLGGLRINTATGALVYDPSILGLGAQSLNAADPKRYEPFIDANSHLSWRDKNGLKSGKYMDGTSFEIDDTLIPEFVDAFPESMPVLYYRAKPGVQVILPTAANYGQRNNSVVTFDPTFTQNRPGSYDLSQNIAYTSRYTGDTLTGGVMSPGSGVISIGTGKEVKKPFIKAGAVQSSSPAYHGLTTALPTATMTSGDPNYTYPYDAFPYFQSSSSLGTARQKDSYILIAAGADRIYGTDDDIVSFGTVGE